MRAHFRMSDTAWCCVIMKRVMLGSVTVTGPPFSICLRNSGMTEPREPITLPNLTDAKTVRLPPL